MGFGTISKFRQQVKFIRQARRFRRGPRFNLYKYKLQVEWQQVQEFFFPSINTFLFLLTTCYSFCNKICENCFKLV